MATRPTVYDSDTRRYVPISVASTELLRRAELALSEPLEGNLGSVRHHTLALVRNELASRAIMGSEE